MVAVADEDIVLIGTRLSGHAVEPFASMEAYPALPIIIQALLPIAVGQASACVALQSKDSTALGTNELHHGRPDRPAGACRLNYYLIHGVDGGGMTQRITAAICCPRCVAMYSLLIVGATAY